MRLIDADVLKEQFSETGAYTCKGVREIIDNAPTVEPKKGKWINFNSYFRKCSLCQKVVGFDYIEQNGETFNFCPNCGAQMLRGDV